MAKITLSADVPDYFVRMDWREAASRPAAFRRELVGHYESGKVIVLDNGPFPIDTPLFSRVSFHAGREYQKLRAAFLTRPKLYKPRVVRAMWQAFAHQPGVYFPFRRAVADLSSALSAFIHDVFCTYRFAKEDVNWRFSPTGPEGLHVDWVQSHEDCQFVRVFVNVDDTPRVWTTSFQLESLIERFYDFSRLHEMQGAPANDICNRLNKAVFDHPDSLPGGRLPRHVIEFPPGAVWLCESRINSHEIFSGRRMVATHFRAAPDSMQNPDLRVEARVARAMAACAGGAVAAE